MVILLGSNPASFTVKLFLYYFENEQIQKTKRRDPMTTRKIGNTFCFIDDMAAIKDDRKLENAL